MGKSSPNVPQLSLTQLRQELRASADPEKAAHAQRFFKTGPGEYGEGDRFLGIRMPPLRQLAKAAMDLSPADRNHLLQSGWHEERMLALLIMVGRFRKGAEAEKERIYEDYLAKSAWINNWDLVDMSAPDIVGGWLWPRERGILDELAASPWLWDRRIAVLATFYLIRRGEFADILRLSEKLLQDPEDLMHKAVGWMLREVGKRDLAVEKAFLDQHVRKMPRTMLRYAIEKFPEGERQAYLRA